MKIEDLTSETRDYIRSCAARCGVTDGDVLNHVVEILSGAPVSIHQRMLTRGKIAAPSRADFSRLYGV